VLKATEEADEEVLLSNDGSWRRVELPDEPPGDESSDDVFRGVPAHTASATPCLLEETQEDKERQERLERRKRRREAALLAGATRRAKKAKKLKKTKEGRAVGAAGGSHASKQKDHRRPAFSGGAAASAGQIQLPRRGTWALASSGHTPSPMGIVRAPVVRQVIRTVVRRRRFVPPPKGAIDLDSDAAPENVSDEDAEGGGAAVGGKQGGTDNDDPLGIAALVQDPIDGIGQGSFIW